MRSKAPRWKATRSKPRSGFRTSWQLPPRNITVNGQSAGAVTATRRSCRRSAARVTINGPPVTRSHPTIGRPNVDVTVQQYQFVGEIEREDRVPEEIVFSVDLPRSVTEFTLPTEFTRLSLDGESEVRDHHAAHERQPDRSRKLLRSRMIRIGLALVGTGILASGCVQGDAPRAGTPARGCCGSEESGGSHKEVAVHESGARARGRYLAGRHR